MKRGFILFILLLACVQLSVAKTVKVGYFIDSGNFMSGSSNEDPKGGYAYEYLQTVASYTGWDYEYVYGYWNELYDKLLKGEIDLLTDVSYSSLRNKLMLYPDYSMGRETYYLYANDSANFFEINELEKLNNKKIALLKDSYQYFLCKNWLSAHNLHPQILEFDYSEDVSEDFNNKKFDFYLDIDTVADSNWEPVLKIGDSEIYTVVTKSRPELLEELNLALNEIYLTNPYYTNFLWAKHFSGIPLTKRLSEKNREWLKNHPTITVGCINNDFPFGDYNQKTQTAEGLISYMMNYFSILYEFKINTINYKFYDTYTELKEALLKDEIQIAYPLTFDLNQAENEGYNLTSPLLDIEIGYVFNSKKSVPFMEKVSIPKGRRTPSYISRNYPSSQTLECSSREECLDAILDEKVSGAVFNMYKIQNIIFARKKYSDLRVIILPERETLCFGVRKDNSPLVSLLNTLIQTMSPEDINSVVTQFSVENKKYSFSEFMNDYAGIIILYTLLFIVVVIALIASLDRLMQVINYDVLTHLLNRRRLGPFMKTALERAQYKNEPFSLLLFDLDDFKKVNDTYGHECGDKILQMAASTISKGVKNKDYVFRWGGEEILVLLKADNEIAKSVANRIRRDIELQCVEYKNQTVKITVTVGIASYTQGSTQQSLFNIADENLYKGKQNGKNQING